VKWPRESSFGDQAVRDLAWLLFSPPLLRASCAGAPLASVPKTDALMDWLAALDRKPAGLHAHARKPGLVRVGLYAEALLEYFLMHGPGPRLIAANVPLRSQGRTIGEVDFLVETREGVRLHWELAVKFYLHIADGGNASLADYVGPNLQDRFDLKHARLLDHQLALSGRPEFASLGFDGPWRAEMFVKGRMFYRTMDAHPDAHPDAHADARAVQAPELDLDHPSGWWKTISEWQKESRQSVCGVLPRLSWIAPGGLDAREGAALIDNESALEAQIRNLRAPLMVAAYVSGKDGSWLQQSCGFVVPDDWPDLARAYAQTARPTTT
jgi:hypothetical protein